jgi:outer membrane protein assembly factor BamB
VAVIAVAASLAVVNATAPPPTTTTLATTTTTVLAMEDTQIASPDDGIGGTALFRGDPGRSGVHSGGFLSAKGFYWRDTPGGDFTTPGAAYGRYLYLSTDENVIYGLEQRGGRLNLTINTDAAVTGALAVGKPTSTEGDATLVFATADGVVHSYNALRRGPSMWDYPTGASVVAPLLSVDDTAFVASTDGYLHALSLDGEFKWRYPLEESAGEFRTAPAYHDGIVYVVSREGFLHLVDAATGEPVCPSPMELIGEVVTHPIISNGVVYVGLETGSLHAFAAGGCLGLPAEGYERMYPSSGAVRLGPAVTGDTMYILEDRLLLALALEAGSAGEIRWTYEAFSIITTPPVFADGVVYVGDQTGVLHAVDAATGMGLWPFDAGSGIRGEPLVVPGAVFVTTADDLIIAIAGE